ncbi:hypothetical protein FOIG_16110 [Fusarium odoratissimum NRRL 54006]|uniref:Uncharacterized protein n=1 Tax=Fusarium odoratissimum (strain NRRL 54006) TaxID=1089451 RepID=X0J2Z0_FUSO5|nr:uncharacterized protein FOIG_16110 [Fusarium odoratissimum NRRL 54006]EXL90645.1 hypothetical protein FOIG_16110 [Fusarium odoratissimum NRRL 54006]
MAFDAQVFCGCYYTIFYSIPPSVFLRCEKSVMSFGVQAERENAPWLSSIRMLQASDFVSGVIERHALVPSTKGALEDDKYDLGLFHDLLVFGAAEMKMAVGVEAD